MSVTKLAGPYENWARVCTPGTRAQMVGASSSSSQIVLVHVKAGLSQAWDHTAAIYLLAGVLGYVKPGGLLSSALLGCTSISGSTNLLNRETLAILSIAIFCGFPLVARLL